MTQTFYPTFDPNEVVQDTMEHVFEANFAAIRDKFSGSSAPSSPVANQWWANTSNSILYIRDASNLNWLQVYNMISGEVYIKDGTITSSMISNAARKGTIVSGENIAPTSCTLRPEFSTVGLFSIPNQLFDQIASFGRLDSGGWQSLLTTKLYVPSGVGNTIYMQGRLTTCKMRFVLNSAFSSETNTISGTNVWTTTAAYISIGAASGWLSLDVQAQTTQGSSPYGGISGISTAWY